MRGWGVMTWERGRGKGREGAEALMSTSMKRLAVSTHDLRSLRVRDGFRSRLRLCQGADLAGCVRLLFALIKDEQ